MRYAELHCKTNFSFLEGASHADELVARAQELGYTALAVTDRESLAGVVRAHVAAKEAGLKLLIGAEVYPVDAPPAVLWATDRQSYGRLCRLLTAGRRRTEKGQCRLTIADVAEHAAGLVAGVRGQEVRSQEPGARSQGEGSRFEVQGSKLGASDTVLHPTQYADIFPGRSYLLAELFHGPDDAAELARLIELSKQSGLPLVAAGDVHYHASSRQPLWEMLTATRLGTTIDRLAEHRFANAQRHLRPINEIQSLFAAVPGALARTLEIAERCTFSLDELKYEYPEELVPTGSTPGQYLAQLTWRGAQDRYPAGIPDKVRGLIEHELALIAQLRYEPYFLTVWDLVRFARDQNILCQGRGSAANSVVCYCLGVTSVDPDRIDVLFERFISAERNEAPDIDIDFEHERREEVLQYLYTKYGRERAGMTAVVITYRTKSAVRDVGKALGLSLDRVDALAKNMEGRELDGHFYASKKGDTHEHPQPDDASSKFQVQSSKSADSSTLNIEPGTLNSPATPAAALARRCSGAGLDPDGPLGRRFIHLVSELVGFPRHLSQHVGGMVLTQGPLCELVPIENAAMPGRTVIEWDKDDLDALGVLKVDCLCLGMLTAIRKCFDMIHQPGANLLPESHDATSPAPLRDQVWSRLGTVPPEDSAVYDMICQADTIGVFQIESRAQMSMLPRLRPREFYDLVIEVAIVRPGPIQGNMVHPYLRRRNGEAVPTYPTPEIAAVLSKTLGVPLFQEQAMRLAVVAAGFTPGEADQLRRAMAAWRRSGTIEKFRQKLIDGMLKRGLSAEFAEQVFNQIRGFGEYGFPESHAASFALLVYVSAWLKHYYPAAFCASIINSQPMGFYAPAQLIRDARAHGVQVLPVDVNASGWDCRLEYRGQESGVRSQGAARGQAISDLGFQISDLVSDSQYSVPGTQYPVPSTNQALRLGLRLITGLSSSAALAIEAARRAGQFTTLDDFVRRTGLSQPIVAKLAEADAFGSLELDRRSALWQALGQEKRAKHQPLFGAIADEDERAADLPPMPLVEQVFADYRTSGFSLKAHPISFFRERLNTLRVTPANDLVQVRHGRRISVAGIVLLRQRPGTARGITFVTLEDETGLTNLVIRPNIWERYYKIARCRPAWIAHGMLESKDSVIHLVVSRLEDLSAKLGDVKAADWRKAGPPDALEFG